jgi:hypothetical protein
MSTNGYAGMGRWNNGASKPKKVETTRSEIAASPDEFKNVNGGFGRARAQAV